MKIGFDGKRAVFNTTGLGNYSRDLIRILLENNPENRYYLYSPAFKSNPRLDFIREFGNIETRLPSGLINNLFKSYWRSSSITGQLADDGIDLYHGLSNELPWGTKHRKFKTLVTIHDLIFIRYPQTYKFIDRTTYRLKAAHCCNNADRVIAISEQTKRDIIDYLNIDEEKIDVVYQGCHPIFREGTNDAARMTVKEKYKLPDNYILNVGTIEERKNLLSLVKAFNMFKLTDEFHLVVVGRPTAYINTIMREITDLGLEKRVIFLHNVDFKDLPSIYSMAEIFVYPSFFEGFGIPIVEALYSKTPVITSKGGCFQEAGGSDSRYINPDDPGEIKSAIDEILGNETLRSSMVEKGHDFVQRFNEKAIAEEIMTVYKNALEN